MDHRVVVSNQSGGSNMLRDYRKGNWTVQETMVLIEAKKMDDERRSMKGNNERGNNKPGGELRWKWVEDYCWKNGCLRSQNQCNDKWDNLMRDFKKVREYEKRAAEENGKQDGKINQEMLLIKSYWKMERSERKEKNLPTNMLPEIYEALVQVVDRKCQKTLVVSTGGTFINPIGTSLTTSLSPTLQQQSIQSQIAPLSLPPPPTLPLSPSPAISQQPAAQPSNFPYNIQSLPTICDSSDHDKSEHSDSPAKRRRKGDQGEGTSGINNVNNLQEVGSAICKSASIIAETIQACEEREERRHRELIDLHERRLQIEESKAEINRQGINGLVDSINRLASSILSLAGSKNQEAPPK